MSLYTTKEKKIVLPNRVRILIEEIPHVYSAAIGFWMDSGSKNEKPDNFGVSHFIEHMSFKGTKKRNAKDIASEIENTGGSINAFTDKENTCFFVRILDKHVPLALNVLSDVLRNSIFDPAEIEKEKQVVLEEIKTYEDSPDELVFDLFLQTIWSDHPLGREIIGTVDTVKGLNRDKICDYIEHFYTPDNLVIAIAGKINTEKIVEQLSELVGNMSNHYPSIPDAPVTMTPGVLVKYKDIEQIHLCLGTKGVAINDERRYVLAIVDNILGGGMGARLFQEIREKRGLVYSISSYQALYRLAGIFGVYAGCSPNNFKEVAKLTIEELNKIKEGKISSDEIEKSKEHIKGGLLLGMEAVRSRMMRLARNELFFGRFLPLDEIVQKIEKVELKDIVDIAEEIFNKDLITFTVVGPIKELPFEKEELFN